MLRVALLYLVCASTFTISKAALQYVDPIFFTGSRMVLAGIILLTYHCWRNGFGFYIQRQHYFLFVQMIVFYIYLAYVLDNVALNYLTSSKACLLYDLSPFITALFSYIWFGEYMTIKKWLGLSIGVAGFLPVLIKNSTQETSIAGTFFSWPELIMLGAIVSSVYGWIVVRQLVKNDDYSSALLNGVAMLGGGILSFITSFFLESWTPVPVAAYGPFIVYTLLIVLVSNLIFANLYTVLLKKYTATLLSFAGFLAPLFAALLGWIFLNETVSWDFFLTTFFVLVGLYIFYKEELVQGYIA